MDNDIQVLENPTFIISGDIQQAINYCNSHKDFKLFRYTVMSFNDNTVLDIGLGHDNGFLELETIYRKFGTFLPVGAWPEIHYDLNIKS